MKAKARLLGRSGSKKRLVVPPPTAAADGAGDAGKAEERGKEAEREEGRERERDRGLLGVRRNKGAGARSWLRIDQSGQTQVIEADKYAIMRRCSIPARDLRILDPLLSYPSTLLGRERAIVVNLEHIKCIIMAEEVLLLNWRNFQVAKVVEELKARLPAHLNAAGQQVLGHEGSGLSPSHLIPALTLSPPAPTAPAPAPTAAAATSAAVTSSAATSSAVTSAAATSPPFAPATTVPLLPFPPPPPSSAAIVANLAAATAPGAPTLTPPPTAPPTAPPPAPPAAAAAIAGAEGVEGAPLLEASAMAWRGPNALPFEFRALEVCLEAACGTLDAETTRVEQEAYPALDELTASVSTLNLERVRQIKSRLVVISGRVQKVRDELEQLLDDDEDMDEMYLTDKLLQQRQAAMEQQQEQEEMAEEEERQRLLLLQQQQQQQQHVHGKGEEQFSFGMAAHAAFSAPDLDGMPSDGEGSEGAGSERAGSDGAGSERAGSEDAGSEGVGSERVGSDGQEVPILAVGQPARASTALHRPPSPPLPRLPHLSISTARGRSHSHSHSHSRAHSHSHSHSHHHGHHELSAHSLPSVAEHGADTAARGRGGEEGSGSEGGSGSKGSRGSRSHSHSHSRSHSRGSGKSGSSKSGSSSSSSSSSSRSSGSKKWDVEELEMLLEAYFVQIEGTLNKLSSLREYVEDTEDYINIMLDEKQNSLLQMNVLLTTATLFISFFIVVTGVFGMNIDCSYFDPENPSNYNVFYYVVIGSTVACIASFILSVVYMRSRGLIVPSA
ncbi:hypothetical protein CLOM_g20872 [Closterium sp. NIES-68]|nr:hypothetical protein CLOM_g20872 [Closterium sp. NIES-68]GJP68507.1 hypothetical protein CLOP_g25204 [Closterium sp. NIES-67]